MYCVCEKDAIILKKSRATASGATQFDLRKYIVHGASESKGNWEELSERRLKYVNEELGCLSHRAATRTVDLLHC